MALVNNSGHNTGPAPCDDLMAAIALRLMSASISSGTKIENQLLQSAAELQNSSPGRSTMSEKSSNLRPFMLSACAFRYGMTIPRPPGLTVPSIMAGPPAWAH
jgi:hypothetical protein